MLQIERNENHMTMEMLGKRVRALRKERGLTQIELATEINIARGYLAGIESGNDHPGREKIDRIASFFGVSRGWLMGDDEYSPNERTFIEMLRQLPQAEAQALEEYLKTRTKSASAAKR